VTTDLSEMIARLRDAGGDGPDVVVKSAAGGLPQSLTSTLSALANLPGGGTAALTPSWMPGKIRCTPGPIPPPVTSPAPTPAGAVPGLDAAKAVGARRTVQTVEPGIDVQNLVRCDTAPHAPHWPGAGTAADS
jgi:hypothetical protein